MMSLHIKIEWRHRSTSCFWTWRCWIFQSNWHTQCLWICMVGTLCFKKEIHQHTHDLDSEFLNLWSDFHDPGVRVMIRLIPEWLTVTLSSSRVQAALPYINRFMECFCNIFCYLKFCIYSSQIRVVDKLKALTQNSNLEIGFQIWHHISVS